MVNNTLEHIPIDKRKKILMLSDDQRLPSGVGIMSREIMMGLAHRFNWVQIGAALSHPEHGKVIDLSVALKNEIGLEDAYMKIYANNGYGDPMLLRKILEIENPDAILHFTDPRQWIWLYQMEAEIRTRIPIFFYHIWDNLPYPTYNHNYYRSCDWISCISKQTYNVVKNVWKKEPPKDWQVSYIPHGHNTNIFKKITEPADIIKMEELRKHLFQGEDVEFSVLYNNRNILRKEPGKTIQAYQAFLQTLPEKQREKCRLVMHTAKVDENGTDLPAMVKGIAPEIKVVFSDQKIPPDILNCLYNIVDVTINLASNEGFGLSTLESLLAETMIIANSTGGLQDQMGFQDDRGNYLHQDRHFWKDWGTNSDGRYQTHGEWAVPVFPRTSRLIGSVPTPFIAEDHCDYRDAADAIKAVYNLGKTERDKRGKLGREFAFSANLTSDAMCSSFDEHMNRAFENWTPKSRFGLYRAGE